MPYAVPPALSLSSQKKAVIRSEEGAGMMSLVSPEYETMYLVYSVPKYVQYGLAGFSAFVFACYFFLSATTQFTKVGVRLTTWPTFSVKKEVSYSS